MKLIPGEKKNFQMFSDVSENLTEGARQLYDILQNPVDLGPRIAKLQEVEHRGDDMTHEIIRASIKHLSLPSTAKIFTGSPRLWMTFSIL